VLTRLRTKRTSKRLLPLVDEKPFFASPAGLRVRIIHRGTGGRQTDVQDLVFNETSFGGSDVTVKMWRVVELSDF
jgi:hypothetical protein